MAMAQLQASMGVWVSNQNNDSVSSTGLLATYVGFRFQSFLRVTTSEVRIGEVGLGMRQRSGHHSSNQEKGEDDTHDRGVCRSVGRSVGLSVGLSVCLFARKKIASSVPEIDETGGPKEKKREASAARENHVEQQTGQHAAS
jgi:hypothetical protein